MTINEFMPNDYAKHSPFDSKREIPFILRQVLSKKDSIGIIQDLERWRIEQDAYNRQENYPKDQLNLHKPVYFSSLKTPPQVSYKDYPLDFKDDRTNIAVHNFRIGNIFDSYIEKKLHSVRLHGDRLIRLYNRIIGKKFSHGDPNLKKNLYLEFAHYPFFSGHIDWHTHHRHIENGQDWNMLTLLSQNGRDHKNSGLQFDINSEIIDTTEMLNQGDAIFFPMGIPHRVQSPLPVQKSDNVFDTQGRWSLSFFYY